MLHRLAQAVVAEVRFAALVANIAGQGQRARATLLKVALAALVRVVNLLTRHCEMFATMLAFRHFFANKKLSHIIYYKQGPSIRLEQHFKVLPATV